MGHFRTITEHKINVMKTCFKVGLYKQGLLHDNSKYYPTEFIRGCMFYQGDKSPNVEERNQIGYSAAWMHHKGRNKHHFEYWNDYSQTPGAGLVPVRMPERYVYEMFIDRIVASKIYKGADYSQHSPLEYYMAHNKMHWIHPDTRRDLEKLLVMLDREGEEFALAYVRRKVVKMRKNHIRNLFRGFLN